MKTELILIKNGLVQIPEPEGKSKLDITLLGTLFSNLAFYGYVLSKEATNRVMKLSDEQAKTWWTRTERFLRDITGESKQMEKFVVYKNFPKEVLDMSQSEYWVKQILMYIGLPNEYFTQDESPRDKMFESVSLKVLHLAKEDSLQNIYNGLLKSPVRWNSEQFNYVRYFVVHQKFELNTKLIPFKENLVQILSEVMDNNLDVKVSSATDILRLAVALSDGDVTFETNSKFKTFNRKTRKFLLSQLENSSNLEEDVARDQERWSKLMFALHPGDYVKKYPKVVSVYKKLYKGDVTSFNGKVEKLILLEDPTVLTVLQNRPGDFVRRFHKLLNVFGEKAVKSFLEIVPKLTVTQLLSIQRYVNTINNRVFLTIAPKGNWTKLKVLENSKTPIKESYRKVISKEIDDVLAKRINSKFKNGVLLSENTKYVKLQTNGSDLTPYGRGTVFEIPKNVTFIRTASYWKRSGEYGHVWFDNSWNFFNENWKSVGECCWNSECMDKAAVFSGDPTNSKEMEGRACQMIDLYIDELVNKGVRYAVWNILCYNRIPFDNVDDVFAALQWGEEPQKGKLFEPSRCQLSFPLRGKNLTKYIAYIDLKERKLVYIDANFKGHVHSATMNGKKLEEVMPAFVEYLDTIPSVYDLFKNAKKNEEGTPVLYTDINVEIKNGKKAYVFKQENKENKFTPVVLTECL